MKELFKLRFMSKLFSTLSDYYIPNLVTFIICLIEAD